MNLFFQPHIIILVVQYCSLSPPPAANLSPPWIHILLEELCRRTLCARGGIHSGPRRRWGRCWFHIHVLIHIIIVVVVVRSAAIVHRLHLYPIARLDPNFARTHSCQFQPDLLFFVISQKVEIFDQKFANFYCTIKICN